MAVIRPGACCPGRCHLRVTRGLHRPEDPVPCRREAPCGGIRRAAAGTPGTCPACPPGYGPMASRCPRTLKAACSSSWPCCPRVRLAVRRELPSGSARCSLAPGRVLRRGQGAWRARLPPRCPSHGWRVPCRPVPCPGAQALMTRLAWLSGHRENGRLTRAGVVIFGVMSRQRVRLDREQRRQARVERHHAGAGRPFARRWGGAPAFRPPVASATRGPEIAPGDSHPGSREAAARVRCHGNGNRRRGGCPRIPAACASGLFALCAGPPRRRDPRGTTAP